MIDLRMGIEAITQSDETTALVNNEIYLDAEAIAIDALDSLMAYPEYAFLSENEFNREKLENENIPASERLNHAFTLIGARAKYTQSESVREPSVEGFVSVTPDYEGLAIMLAHVRAFALKVGEGKKANVIAHSAEMQSAGSKMCYKVMREQKGESGGNSLAQEAEMQQAFFDIARSYADPRIGVPFATHFFISGKTEVLSMELLNARSLSDIREGKGEIPSWVDIDEIEDVVLDFIQYAHAHGVHHRDLNPGNIMITQESIPDTGKPMVYIIDFGSACRAKDGINPYETTINGNSLTNEDDHSLIASSFKFLRSKQ